MNVIFLDIDGVLQPFNSKNRFLHRDRDLIKILSNAYNVDYSIYDYYDVAAVYYDWDEQAVYRLKYILNETNSKIIVSCNWRSNKFPNKMKDLLTIQGLDNYWFTDNVILHRQQLYDTLQIIRFREICDSLNKYEIDNFVVLDDWREMVEFFPNHSVITHNVISDDNMTKCIRILKR